MIKLPARKIQEHCDPRRDFVVLFQSHDWEARCGRMVAEFNAAVRQLYDEDARSRGGIEAEDRHGARRFFGFIGLHMGVVSFAGAAGTRRAADVANAAALAKQRAKQCGLAIYEDMLVDRRDSPTALPDAEASTAMGTGVASPARRARQ